jgi:hypothetical protein
MSASNTHDLSARTDRAFPLQGGASASLVVGIGLALVVEGVALHFWVAARHPAWAWAITALNAATLAWLWLDYRARTLATLTLGDRDVVITVGNQLRCQVARLGIASAELATWRSVPDPDMARDYVNTAKPLEPNVLLTFGQPVDARLPFGIRKRLRRLGVRVGDPERLISEIASAPARSPR